MKYTNKSDIQLSSDHSIFARYERQEAKIEAAAARRRDENELKRQEREKISTDVRQKYGTVRDDKVDT